MSDQERELVDWGEVSEALDEIARQNMQEQLSSAREWACRLEEENAQLEQRVAAAREVAARVEDGEVRGELLAALRLEGSL